MPFSFHDEAALTETHDERGFARRGTARGRRSQRHPLPLILDKITVPDGSEAIERPRLRDFYAKAARQFPANLISGRSETGKTYAGVDLSRDYANVAWYSLDPTDNDWTSFSNYFATAISAGISGDKLAPTPTKPRPEQISAFLEKLFSSVDKCLRDEEMLIVLDDIHHVFDAPWFADFFNLLLFSTPPNAHLLLLCRSKPPLPLWRLRSKQVLNVIDEKLLAFDDTEIAELCLRLGRNRKLAQKVPETAKGRVGKLVDFIRTA